MVSFRTLALSCIALIFSVGIAQAKPHKDFRALTKINTEWVFDFVDQTPAGGGETSKQTWTVAEATPMGKGAVRVILLQLEEKDGRERDSQFEFIIQGSKLYDISWLERTRPTEDVGVGDLPKRSPILDIKKTGKATVIREKGNPRAWVRYEKLKSYKAANGKTYKGVYAFERNRGATENRDQWWYHPKAGILHAVMTVPTLGGGGKFIWKRQK